MGQIRKEEVNGILYLASQYTNGMLPGMSPRARQARQRQTSAYKQLINKKDRKWALVKKVNANFEGGRDLFVCLTFAQAPASERACLQGFHGKLKKDYAALGLEHSYICVRETHGMDGIPVRLHYHLFLRGAAGAGMYQKLKKIIQAAWPYGSVDVRILDSGGDFFESTVKYLLKEKRARGERAYSCSRNLKPPAEPVRRRVAETARLEAPPGVKLFREIVDANEFGRFSFCVGCIVDPKRFHDYWAGVQKQARPDPWERIRRRKYALARTRAESPP